MTIYKGKKCWMLFLIVFVNVNFVFGNYSLSGIVKDSTNDEGLPFASIQLENISDTNMVNVTMTDINGHYKIEGLSSGKYKIMVSYMGYDKYENYINIQTKKQKLNIFLKPSSFNLDEIEVTAEKNLVEKSIEKTVVNVSKDNTVSGGTAMDVMKSIPSVDVDIDGKINYRGSEKVVILINGEKSELVKSLDQVSSEQIDRVEVINNPSAKYDAEGMSGIINIVMKSGTKGKNKTTFMLKGGYPENYGGSVGYSGSSTKVSYFINASANHKTKFQTKEHLRENYEDPSGFNYYQFDRQDENLNNAFVNTGANIKINKKHSVGFSLFSTTKINTADRWIDYQTMEKDQTVFYETDKDIKIGLNNYSIDGKLTYNYKLNQKGSKIGVKAHYSILDQDQSMDNTFYPEPDYEFPELQKTLAKQFNKNGDIAVDYFLPLNDSLYLESGYQSNISDVTNNFFSDSYNYSENTWEEDIALENNFNYVQFIHAAYLDVKKKFKKIEILAGLRTEYTITEQNGIKKDDYLNFFPSVTLSMKLNKNYTVYTSLNRRINRPNIKMVNPYSSEYADLLNMHKGNPDLKPEYINTAEAGTRFVFEKISGMGSVYFRDIEQAVSRIKSAFNDSALIVSFINLDRALLTGAELSVSYKPFKWWTINASCNIFYTRITGSFDYNQTDKSKNAWNGNLSNKLKLPWKINLQFTGYYRSKLPSVMGIYKERYYMDAGISRKILNNKGRLVFKISDLFNTYLFGLDLDALDEKNYRYSQINRKKNETRYFILSFIYNIEGKDQEKKNGKESFFLNSFDK